VLHSSICLHYQVEYVLRKWKCILRNSCGCYTFQNALPHFYFSSFLWYLAGVKRQNDKKSCCFTQVLSEEWGTCKISTPRPLTPLTWAGAYFGIPHILPYT
jgi:hypothetical protein